MKGGVCEQETWPSGCWISFGGGEEGLDVRLVERDRGLKYKEQGLEFGKKGRICELLNCIQVDIQAVKGAEEPRRSCHSLCIELEIGSLD